MAQAPQIESIDQARMIAQMLADGKVAEDKREEAVAALETFQHTLEAQKTQQDRAQNALAPADEQPDLDETALEKAANFAKGVGTAAVGTVDIGATLATNAVSAPISGLAGLGGAAVGAVVGDDEMAFRWQAKIEDMMTWSPKSRGAKKAIEVVAPTLAKIERGMMDGIEVASSGNAVSAAYLQTTLLGALELLGAKAIRSSLTAGRLPHRQLLKQTDEAIAELGINPKNKTIREGTLAAAQRMAPAERGTGSEAIVSSLRQESAKSKAAVTSLYEKAKQGNAIFNVDSARELSADIRNSLADSGMDLSGKGFDDISRNLDVMANLDQFIPSKGNLKRAASPTGAKTIGVRMNEMEILRKRFNRIGRSKLNIEGGEEAAAAAFRAGRAIDDVMTNTLKEMSVQAGQKIKFGDGPISGSADDIRMWREARDAYKKHASLYKDEKAIAKMINENMTSEEVSTSILGMSALGSRREAARIVELIREGTGGDSSVMNSLRAEAMYNIMEPLIQNAPNGGRTFARNYNYITTRNPSLMKELGLDSGPIKMLAKIAEVADDLPTPGRSGVLKDVGARFLASRFGHEIARKGFQQNVLKQVFTLVLLGGNRVSKAKIIKAVGGVDPDLPLFANKPLFVAEMTATGLPTSMQELLDEARKP